MTLNLPEILTPSEVSDILRILRSASGADGWQDGRITSGKQAASVKNNQQMPESGAATHAARAIVLAALARHPLFLSAALPRRIAPPLFNRYADHTNAFGSHIDNALRTLPLGDPQGSGYLRTDLSCTLWLTDPANYAGGELVIAEVSGEQPFKAAAGSALLYPATHLHRVNPVTRGERIACFFWVESLVRSAEQRDLLWNLDMALLQLRAQHGESAETIALTGSYHNLLRMWAET